MKCSPETFRKAHAIFNDFARAFPGTTARDWKEVLCSLLPAFLAEAEGREIPPPAPRESTLEMDAWRMNDLIEMSMWLGTELGIEFKDDAK